MPRVLAATAAVAGGLLVACGDDDAGNDVATIEDFCSAMERVNVQLDSDGYFETSGGDESAAALEAVGDVDPPGEIAKAWGTVIDATEAAVDVEANDDDYEGTDATNAAGERVRSYVDVQCSVDLGSS